MEVTGQDERAASPAGGPSFDCADFHMCHSIPCCMLPYVRECVCVLVWCDAQVPSRPEEGSGGLIRLI